LIDPYTMKFHGSVRPSKNTYVDSKKAVFWRGEKSIIFEIVELEYFCMKHRGRPSFFCHALSRDTSPYVSAFFELRIPVFFRDATDQCIRASVANAVSLVVGEEAATEFWQREMDIVIEGREKRQKRKVRHFRDLQRLLTA